MSQKCLTHELNYKFIPIGVGQYKGPLLPIIVLLIICNNDSIVMGPLLLII